jgi:hypothetical protein
MRFGKDVIEIVVNDGHSSVDARQIMRAIGYMPRKTLPTSRVSGESLHEWLASIRPADVRPNLRWKLSHFQKGLVYGTCTYLANRPTAGVGGGMVRWAVASGSRESSPG